MPVKLVIVGTIDILPLSRVLFFLFFFFFHFILCLSVWGVEPDVTHQTSWLGSTGECGVPQNHAGENSAQRKGLISFC